jgi:tetratricopeptide (TPR) repeat protein
VYYNQKQDDKAFWYFDQIVKKDPKGEEAREVLPMIKKIFQTKGDIEGMEKYFANIGNPLSVNEIEKDLYTSIQEAYYNEKNCDVAIPKLENYIAKFPDGKYINEVQFSYGECTYSKNMFDKALAAYQFIIGKSRSIYSEVAYSKAAYILFKDKKYTEALPIYQQMQEISETPSNKLTAKLGAMRCAFYLNQYETALSESNKVLSSEKLSPQQTSEAKYIKAKSLFETQRYDDALADFKIIAKTSKNLTGAEAYYHIAKIYFLKKEYKETEKAVNSLISYEFSNDDWNTKGMLLIADVYIEKGDDKDAEVILQTIIDGKPKQEFIDEANKRLDQIKQRRESRLNAEQNKQQDFNIEFKSNNGDKNLYENQGQNEQQNTTKPEEPK